MKFKGGYNVLLQGKPEDTTKIKRLPEPESLYLPLQSRRFAFGEIHVKNGQNVCAGDTVARDKNNYSLPLLAPRAGVVKLEEAAGHIVLTNLSVQSKINITAEENGGKLLSLGAWQFFYDAYTDELPNPTGSPQAVIVSTVSFEPFTAMGRIQIKDKLSQFAKGLEYLRDIVMEQPIYLVVPQITSVWASQFRQRMQNCANVSLVEIPAKYPYDNFSILARKLGLKKQAGPIWAVRTEGVLAVEQALTSSKPCTSRTISIGGPAAASPCHIEIMPGYPIRDIFDIFASETEIRAINGGILTGEPVTKEILGIDTECRGLTILPECREREFLGFARPGWDRNSYSGCFASALGAGVSQDMTTALRGEPRPCISCNFCEEVCPAGIMPHLLHKYLYSNLIEDVERGRIDLCIECGLCSFVCPSKIDLKNEFVDAKELIEKEKNESVTENF